MLALRSILALIGFSSVAAQVLLLRELLVLFGGSEISLGWMLAAWLLWTAAGSGVFGRFGQRHPRRTVALLNLSAALVLPLTFLAARILKPALSSTPGELAGPAAMLAASLLTLAPFCSVSGWLFSAAARLYRQQSGQETAAAMSSVYWMESAGSALGGILASLLLLRFLDPLALCLLVSLLNLLSSMWLLSGLRALLLAALFTGPALILAAPRLERLSLNRMWSPFHLVAVRNSVYGNLALIGREGARALYQNGAPLFQVPDPESAERAVHYALLQHPAPRAVLVAGGGAGGALTEVLKHRTVESVDYVELDPAIVRLALSDLNLQVPPRVHIHYADGRLFLKTTRGRFDVILLNLPEPQTAQLNRFYTVEFFAEAATRLNPGGVFSFALASSENYISPARAAFLRCIYKTLSSAFPETGFLPGSTIRFLASNRPGALIFSPSALLERLRDRGIQTLYVSPSYLPYELTPGRFEFTARALQPQPDTPLNRDFAPVAFYFDALLWATRFQPGAPAWLTRAASFGYGGILWTTAALAWTAAFLLCLLPRPAHAAAFATFSSGAALMTLEILLLLGFQAIYGYVYSQLAILIALFMAGMSLGARAALSGPPSLKRLAWIQILVASAPLLVCWAMQLQSGAARTPYVFSALAAACGFLGGYQFPVAGRVFFSPSTPRRADVPGALYALDLAGACLAASLASAFLIPLYGFWRAAILMAAVSLAPALPAWFHARRAPAP